MIHDPSLDGLELIVFIFTETVLTMKMGGVCDEKFFGDNSDCLPA